MAPVAEKIREIVDEDPFIREALVRDYANYSKLADWIIRNHDFDEERERTIVSALTRYQSQLAEGGSDQMAAGVDDANVDVDSRLCVLALPRTARVRSELCDFYDEIDFARDETLQIVPGDENVLVVVDEKRLSTAQEVFGPGRIEMLDDDLAGVQVRPPGGAEPTPGWIWTIVSVLRTRGITPRFFLSSHPDHLVFVPRSDGTDAYEAIRMATQADGYAGDD